MFSQEEAWGAWQTLPLPTRVHSSRSVTQDPELTRVAAGSGEDVFSLQAF